MIETIGEDCFEIILKQFIKSINSIDYEYQLVLS